MSASSGKEQQKASPQPTTDSDARSASQPEQAEREAVGERKVEPASLRQCLQAIQLNAKGPAKRWADERSARTRSQGNFLS